MTEESLGILLREFDPNGDTGWVIDVHRAHYRDVEGFDDSFAPVVARAVDAFDPIRDHGWIACAGLEQVGSLFMIRENAQVARLKLFYIAASCRGQGLGRLMLHKAERSGRRDGTSLMRVRTFKQHTAAVRLYVRSGFELVEEFPVHEFGRPLVEQCWEKALDVA
ncbi:GNAT family N-acetyltransferase [Qingshengfaniella alkalisoli]|uniref:GNAT family N-acetyltransferase n=1 Tax=Qingshengfaniella alkalisoli TaxID=2599296 RepID=A0A5B8IVB9_9RHOB|nr:GNAT family N-acetyltransferase [Qingshengfaniella alkalisoli]QDY68811.1 GNAT family N-acetyltransferase [Qingshengfaniella alkalisoli]